MTSHRSEPYSLLIEIARTSDVSTVRSALDHARIPFHSGLLAGSPPRVLFYVPADRLEDARVALSQFGDQAPPAELEDEIENRFEEVPSERDRRFPWGPVQLVSAVVTAHLLVVLWVHGPWPPGIELLRAGGLIAGRMLEEPWRLVTALFLHATPGHALWNGLSMLVFSVPLLLRLGPARTASIYLAAGVGGGTAAVSFADAPVTIIGSSGAVAGLFGAWVLLTLGDSRSAVLGLRSRIRTAGIALLFLPSLLNPTTATGRPVSVSSHLGGMITGMLIGAVLSSRMVRRKSPATEPPPD